MADGFELFTDRSVVAMRVNGELKDLATTVTDTDVVEPVTIESPPLDPSPDVKRPKVVSRSAPPGHDYVTHVIRGRVRRALQAVDCRWAGCHRAGAPDGC